MYERIPKATTEIRAICTQRFASSSFETVSTMNAKPRSQPKDRQKEMTIGITIEFFSVIHSANKWMSKYQNGISSTNAIMGYFRIPCKSPISLRTLILNRFQIINYSIKTRQNPTEKILIGDKFYLYP